MFIITKNTLSKIFIGIFGQTVIHETAKTFQALQIERLIKVGFDFSQPTSREQKSFSPANSLQAPLKIVHAPQRAQNPATNPISKKLLEIRSILNGFSNQLTLSV